MPWKDPERRKEYRRRWYLNNKEHHLETVKAYKKRRPDIVAKVQRKYNYGITQDQWEELLKTQGNMCWICEKSFDDVKPVVDHDHNTGIIRGILCTNCNVGLGRFKDNPRLLMQAVAYLEKGKV